MSLNGKNITILSYAFRCLFLSTKKSCENSLLLSMFAGGFGRGFSNISLENMGTFILMGLRG